MGEVQALKYTGQINASFFEIASNPEKGKACPEIREGYRKLRVGGHFIFYREKGGIVEIVRILHGKMSFAMRL
ncbi:type II toxin-antitoxin system RelE/ParE family toxin [Desulfosarcina sp. OttesenSCG-928-A07]|nr:type II toxin-antitoxin system RelE/ParE family toxin [Desulfosarcina sp. OttesenSCG-928-G17]MDL2328929.1 type II toxin-antitoxin system RelE/ParE family toxin [Desulfosarcina sp. OttesenSCG-928-A07]